MSAPIDGSSYRRTSPVTRPAKRARTRVGSDLSHQPRLVPFVKAISEMFEIVPLSPLRACAICHSFMQTTSTGTVQGTSARGMNVDATATTSRIDRGRAAAARRAVGVQRLDFFADALGDLARRCAGGDPHAHFVRLRRCGRHRLAVQGADADQVAPTSPAANPERSSLSRATAAASRARPTAPAARVRDLPFADVAVAIIRARPSASPAAAAGRAVHGDAVVAPPRSPRPG